MHLNLEMLAYLYFFLLILLLIVMVKSIQQFDQFQCQIWLNKYSQSIKKAWLDYNKTNNNFHNLYWKYNHNNLDKS